VVGSCTLAQEDEDIGGLKNMFHNFVTVNQIQGEYGSS
jgi:hypothetical protein